MCTTRNRWEVAELQLEALLAVEALETRRLQDQEANATMLEAESRGLEPGGDADDEEDGDIDEAAYVVHVPIVAAPPVRAASNHLHPEPQRRSATDAATTS